MSTTRKPTGAAAKLNATQPEPSEKVAALQRKKAAAKAKRRAAAMLTAADAKRALLVARPAESPCLCGCGGLTKGRFVPGHDAKLKVALEVTAADGTGKAQADAKAALAIFGW